jgi:hypothetical protein
MSNPERDRILTRRALFVGTALASVGFAACDRSQTPDTCLSIAPVGEDAGQDPAPTSTIATDPVDPPPAEPQEPEEPLPPEVCLRVAPPQPCLSVTPG